MMTTIVPLTTNIILLHVMVII